MPLQVSQTSSCRRPWTPRHFPTGLVPRPLHCESRNETSRPGLEAHAPIRARAGGHIIDRRCRVSSLAGQTLSRAESVRIWPARLSLASQTHFRKWFWLARLGETIEFPANDSTSNKEKQKQKIFKKTFSGFVSCVLLKSFSLCRLAISNSGRLCTLERSKHVLKKKLKKSTNFCMSTHDGLALGSISRKIYRATW